MSRPALVYRGSRALSGVPARDLTAHDVDRLAYVRHMTSAEVAAWLISTRIYRKPGPARPVAPEATGHE